MPGTKRVTGEESWTKVKACQLDQKSMRAMKENLDVDKNKSPELHEVDNNDNDDDTKQLFYYYQVKSVNPNVFIGMDVVKVKDFL